MRARPRATVVGVARLYAPIAATLVIDPVDAHLAGRSRTRACARRGAVGDEHAGDRREHSPARVTGRRRPDRMRSRSSGSPRRGRSTAPTRGGCGPASATPRLRVRSPVPSGAGHDLGAAGSIERRRDRGPRSHAGADVDHQAAATLPARTSASTASSTNRRSRGLAAVAVDDDGSPTSRGRGERGHHAVGRTLARAVDVGHRQRGELDRVLVAVHAEQFGRRCARRHRARRRRERVALLDRQVARRHLAVQRPAGSATTTLPTAVRRAPPRAPRAR